MSNPVLTPQVSRGLNLQLELKDPTQMPALMLAINRKKDSTYASLQSLHFVHFARFLPTRDNRILQVITSFDGPIQAYVLDFVIAIGDVFDAILSFVKDAPPLPVRDYPVPFLEFVKKNNRVVVQEPVLAWDEYPLYSAYPNTTVVDILGPRTTPPVVRPVAPAEVNRADVQGNILAGYRAHCARHYALRIHDSRKARALLLLLVDGNGYHLPTITTAQPWQSKPEYMLNLGVTAQGLRALGVPADQMVNLPTAFLEGPGHPDRAQANGDTGASSPEHWEMGGARTSTHLLLSLYASESEDHAVFEQRHIQLLVAFGEHDLQLLHQHDTQALPNNAVHFGYRDSISQPRLALATAPDSGAEKQPEVLPLSSVGEFLLGSQYTSVYGGSSLGQMPAALCENASFAALRVIDQDVAAFEGLLDRVADEYGVDREWVAAKLMGRWRDGTPLSPLVSPVDASKERTGGHLPRVDLVANAPGTARTSNAFDYSASVACPQVPQDHAGLVCPVGAHIRRLNPRSAMVAGQPYSRRIVRRGMPYGPAWDENHPHARRGLFGFFICADIERQFEFMLQQWANGDSAASGIKGTQDPIIGAQNLSGRFEIPRPNGQPPLSFEVPRWCTTRASLYLLLPSINGLRWLVQGVGFDDSAAQKLNPAAWLSTPPSIRTAAKLVPSALDPLDADFLRNPYPYYALFRQHAPVFQVQRGSYQAYWVFGHAQCQEAAMNSQLFLKAPSSQPHAGRGMFTMDPPEHAGVRAAINPPFAQAMAGVQKDAQTRALNVLKTLSKTRLPGQLQRMDLVADVANPVFGQVFMHMFGLPSTQWSNVDTLARTMLASFSPMAPADQRRQFDEAAMTIVALLEQLAAAQCPVHAGANATGVTGSEGRTAGGLFQRIMALAAAGTPAALGMPEGLRTGLDFILGGYLSSAFLLGTGLYHLQQHPHAWQMYLKGGDTLRKNAFEEIQRFDPPFQLADRYAAQDTMLCGVRIPKDARVCLVLGSANRDAAVFGKDAERLDIERMPQPEKNLAFGWGEHHCIGRPMAQITVPTVLNVLADHCDALKLDLSAAQWGKDPYFRAFDVLPARLSLRG